MSRPGRKYRFDAGCATAMGAPIEELFGAASAIAMENDGHRDPLQRP